MSSQKQQDIDDTIKGILGRVEKKGVRIEIHIHAPVTIYAGAANPGDDCQDGRGSTQGSAVKIR